MKSVNKVALMALLALSSSGIAFSQKVFTSFKVPGSSPNTMISINNGGQVVVNTGTSASYDVSIWNRISGSEVVGLIGPTSGGAGLNAAGDVVGAGDPDNLNYFQAFVWQPVGGVQWLGSLGGDLSAANGINASGAVVGQSYTGTYAQHAFLWTQAGGMQDLTIDLTSIGGATATAINSSNQVVGYYFPNGSRNTLGFLWTQAGGLQNFGSTGTLAFAINDSGTVVGQSPFVNAAKHAFSWTQTGGITDLGTLGGSASSAQGINNRGWIVGTSLTTSKNGLLHGFLWTASGGMKDFTVVAGLGQSYQIYSAQVNDSGVIAMSTNKGSYLLVPTMIAKVTSSVNPSTVGQAVTFSANLTSIAGAPPDGEAVQFVVGKTVLGSAVLTGGVATLTTSALPAGKDSVVAKYIGDVNYLPTTFTAFVQMVNQ
jgi:probable HAF family extracellular repeat protein